MNATVTTMTIAYSEGKTGNEVGGANNTRCPQTHDCDGECVVKLPSTHANESRGEEEEDKRIFEL